ncbi:MAG: Hpt domain-containing protein [Gammaproteobacteria bacterium]|nr:Hpt domain-containing protein [Gammaproteobacteria bacterium]
MKHSNEAVFDRDDLMERVGDDASLIAMIASSYLEDLPDQWLALQNALQDNDYTRIAAAAHQIRGASGNVGGKALSCLCKEIELTALAKNSTQLQWLAGLLDNEVIALRQQLENEI